MSKKRAKKEITFAEAVKNIPCDEFYCNDSGRCPYFRIRHYSKKRLIKEMRKDRIFGIPVWYGREHVLEYCVFLKRHLWVQDGCKDCGINEYDPEYQERKRISMREQADDYKEKFPEEAELIDQIVKEDNVQYFDKKEEKK